MKRYLGWILWLLTALACEAAEIVAWKVPLNRYVELGLDAAGTVRCKSAPEPSPFFKDGDVLWDLKGVSATDRIETEPPLEWVVWNENSESLVIKADWNGIWQLHQRLQMDELPKQCRVTLEVFEVQGDGLPQSEKSVPSMVLSGVSKSAQQCEATQQEDGRMMHMKATACVGEGDPVVTLDLEASISLPDQPGLEFKGGFSMSSGSAVWIARDFDGAKGMDLRLTSSIEFLDGTPLSQALLIQKGDAVAPIEMDRSPMQRHRIGDKGWITAQWLYPDILVNMDSPDTSEDPFAGRDPFAPEKPKTVPIPHLFKEVMVPEILRPWFKTPVWDLRELVKKQGLELKDGSDFAGYDPLTQRVFIFSNSESLLDMFDQLYSMCNHRPTLAVVTFEGNGQTRLLTRSGQAGRLKRTMADQKVIRSFEIEPTVGENNDIIDLRLVYRDESIARQKLAIETAITLRTGKSLELISGGAGEGKRSSLRVTGGLIRMHD